MEFIFKTKKRVLIISGDPRMLAEMKKGLRDSFETVIASEEGLAANALDEFEMDAAVICAGGDTPAPAFKKICERIAAKSIPFLFLTEHDDEETERAAFAMGAVDYCVKRSGVGEAFISRLNLRIGLKRKPARGTVLVAEDVALNRDIIGVMLSDMGGPAAEFAKDGLDAVEKFSKSPESYALILMDIHMPRMDGLSAAKAIRRLCFDAAKKIPIIALTANTDNDDVNGFMEAGMNGYLKKPMEYEKLTDVIHLCLS